MERVLSIAGNSFKLFEHTFVLEWPIDRFLCPLFILWMAFANFLHEIGWLNAANKPECFVSWFDIDFNFIQMLHRRRQRIQEHSVHVRANFQWVHSILLCLGQIVVEFVFSPAKYPQISFYKCHNKTELSKWTHRYPVWWNEIVSSIWSLTPLTIESNSSVVCLFHSFGKPCSNCVRV